VWTDFGGGGRLFGYLHCLFIRSLKNGLTACVDPVSRTCDNPPLPCFPSVDESVIISCLSECHQR
jgi:hypothetical protein